MADFSCYVSIYNSSTKAITRDDCQAVCGHWASGAPPLVIPPQQSADFQIIDPTGAAEGSEGWVTYSVTDANNKTGIIKFYFTCPYAEDNSVSATWQTDYTPNVPVRFRAKSDNNDWKDNTVQADGHPVYVIFTLG